MIGIIKKIYSKMSFDTITNPNEEHLPFDIQKAYVDNYPNPKDDYERSFYKYQCWKTYFFSKKNWLIFLFNIGSMFLLPVMMRRLKKNDNQLITEGKKYDAVVENVPRLPNYDVIPEEISDLYKEIVEITNISYFDGVLGEKGLSICKLLRKKYFFHFYFRLITALKLAQFEMYIKKYRPEAIVFYSYEREFSGPLQTYLCELYGKKFISYMHGDLLYSMAFAFQRYSELYIWGNEYSELFNDLRCVFSPKTYLPKKLDGIASLLPTEQCAYFATYYFSCETRACAEVIRDIFNVFKEKGLSCKIRPHPRYSDTEMLKEVFRDYYVEDPKKCSLGESITQSLYIVGLNTTVLSQAYFSGKKVVIDDISKSGEYQELLKKGYVMLYRKHLKLSELIKDDFEYDNSCMFYL